MTSEFGKEVKKALVDRGQSQKQLILQVKEKTGLYLDSAYLSKILAGKKVPPRIVAAIREILEIT